MDPQITKPAREGDFWVAPFLRGKKPLRERQRRRPTSQDSTCLVSQDSTCLVSQDSTCLVSQDNTCLVSQDSTCQGCQEHQKLVVSGTNVVTMARHGLILKDNEATGSGKVFRYLRGFRDTIKKIRNGRQSPKIPKRCILLYFPI